MKKSLKTIRSFCLKINDINNKTIFFNNKIKT